MPLKTREKKSGIKAGIEAWLTVSLATAMTLSGFTAAAATNCSVSVTPMVFGNYNPVHGLALHIDATVTASCITNSLSLPPMPYTLKIGASSTSGNMARQLAGPMGARLSYNVYTSGSYGSVWGDGSGGTSAVSGSVQPLAVGVPAAAVHTAYGKVPALQSVRVGAYGDGLIVTIDY